MNIIDVTLRDGGHAVKFDWDINFAKEYYNLVSNLNNVNYTELGYWKQTEKSKNTFYNLNMDDIYQITQRGGLNNVSVMIDYHYCNKNLQEYPDNNQSEIAMIRLCSRKQDIDDAINFGKELKAYTKLKISLNIFNASNYTYDELMDISSKIKSYPFDYIYLADTHGNLNLKENFNIFKDFLLKIKETGKLVGFHLHDHKGLAVLNYYELLKHSVDSTDTSIRGMGKGSGNLKLEHVTKNGLTNIASFIKKYETLLTIKPTPYELITSKNNITDNYAKFAKQINMPIEDFNIFCRSLIGVEKDSYNKNLLTRYYNA